jgi:hypothetical protein
MKKIYPPVFTRIDISKKTARKIHFVQTGFERFCESMSRRCPGNEERQQAVYRMQEACVWFCRSLAKRDYVAPELDLEIDIAISAPVVAEPTPEEIEERERDEAALIKAHSLEIPEYKPTIIFKKKTYNPRAK